MKVWHQLIPHGSSWKAVYGNPLKDRLKRGSSSYRFRRRALHIYKNLEFDFDPSLELDDALYEQIKTDAPFLHEAANAFRPYVNRMLDEVARLIIDYSLEHRTDHQDLRNDILRIMVEAEGQVMYAGELQLEARKKLRKEAHDYRWQRLKDVGKSGVRIAGGVTGAGLATASAVASGGLSILGAVLAWYGALRTVVGAAAETWEAYRNIWKQMKDVEDSLKDPLSTGYGRSVASGAVRGFLGASPVDTLPKLISRIGGVRAKLPQLKKQESKLAGEVNSLLDAQENVSNRIKAMERQVIEDGAVFTHDEARLIAKLKNELLEKEAGLKTFMEERLTKGSDFVERWLQEAERVSSRYNRVAGRLQLAENVTANGISFGLNSVATIGLTIDTVVKAADASAEAAALGVAVAADAPQPPSAVDWAGLGVTAAFDLEQVLPLIGEVREVFGEE